MLGAIKRALGVGGAKAAADVDAAACAGCDPDILAQCSAAEAGSVTPHAAHVFIKLAAPAGGADPAAATDEAWWPESVDKEAAIEAVNVEIKAAGDRFVGKIKVTAFDYACGEDRTAGALAAGTCDALVFPAGRAFHGLPLEQLPAAVVAALAGEGAPEEGEEAFVQGTMLFVCCHAARDERCGALGPPLVAKLAQLAEARGLGGSVRVLKTSHVGGHKYAGNVLVYRRGQACDGDWFGGLHAGNAEQFFEALLAAKAPTGAAGERALRGWWRGRVGLSKEQQLQHFEAALRDIEDLR